MDVIIVSKTHMSSMACIGGVLADGRLVRLLNENGYNQPGDTKLNIGDVYKITFKEKAGKRPPHVEDILVSEMIFKSSFASIEKMVNYLQEKIKVKIWRGSPEVLFDGKLQWTTSGSGYISESGEIPANSVGFWIPDRVLTRNDYEDKVKYIYQHTQINSRKIPFVGYQTPVDTIPTGTLLRVSLARWWKRADDEERCYLQLSGWYVLAE